MGADWGRPGNEDPREDVERGSPGPGPHEAAAAGDFGAVERFLSMGLGIDSRDADGFTLLHRAILGGSLGMAQALIQAGADPDAKDRRGFGPRALAGVRGLGTGWILDAILEARRREGTAARVSMFPSIR